MPSKETSKVGGCRTAAFDISCHRIAGFLPSLPGGMVPERPEPELEGAATPRSRPYSDCDGAPARKSDEANRDSFAKTLAKLAVHETTP